MAPSPIPISVTNGTNIDQLVDVVYEQLPSTTTKLAMPNCSDAMSVVSWAYDHATVENVDYEDEMVHLTVRGRPTVIEQAKAKAATIAG
ncbi:hypothetical protein [Haladaptatus sp. NG-SE-30]